MQSYVALHRPDYVEVFSGGEDLVLAAGEVCDDVLRAEEVPPRPVPRVEILQEEENKKKDKRDREKKARGVSHQPPPPQTTNMQRCGHQTQRKAWNTRHTRKTTVSCATRRATR